MGGSGRDREQDPVTRIYFYTLMLLVACKGRQGTVMNEPVAEVSRPAWVLARPVDDLDYIGIGSCPKARADYQESAKKNALNDLSSEISVRVEGNSLLSSLDSRTRFTETYQSNIRTTSNEQLEGFEMVDSWQDAREYWVYYRLDKSVHARIKAERKEKALAIARDGFGRAQERLAAGDLKGAFDQDLRALIAMKEYWGENDQVTVGDRQVPLANAIFADLQRLTSSVRFAPLPERCLLDYSDRFAREMLITASFSDGTLARRLVQLPVTFSWPGTSGRVSESRGTDEEGHVRATVKHVEMNGATADLLVRLNMDEMVSPELDPVFVRPVVSSLTVPEVHVPIDLTMPRLHVTSNETNLGQPVSAGIAIGIKEELTAKGFRIVGRPADADLLLDLRASTREGGQSNGFFTTLLDVTWSFRDRRTNDVVVEGGRQGVKGIQLDHVKAGLDAYKKAGNDLRKELVSSMLNTLL